MSVFCTKLPIFLTYYENCSVRSFIGNLSDTSGSEALMVNRKVVSSNPSKTKVFPTLEVNAKYIYVSEV